MPTYPYVEFPDDAVILEVGFEGSVKLGKCISIINEQATTEEVVPIFQARMAQRDEQGRLIFNGRTYDNGDSFSASIHAYDWNTPGNMADPEAQKIDKICNSQGSVFVIR